jgi:cyclophilin family peptidyl-prolyl cis-trans isomerase
MAFPWFPVIVGLLASASRFWVHLDPAPRPLPPEPSSAGFVLPPALSAAAHHPIALGDQILFDTSEGTFTVVLFPAEAPTYTRHLLELVNERGFRQEGIWRRQPGDYVELGGPDTDLHTAAFTSTYALLPTSFDTNALPEVMGSLVLNRRIELHGRDQVVRDDYAIVTDPGGYFPGTVIGQVVIGLDVARRLHPGSTLNGAIDLNAG